MTGFSPATRKIIIDRSGGMCERCGNAPVEQLHHRRPRGAGGSKRDDTNTPANAFGVCAACHLHIESNRTEALQKGWLVRQGQDPRTIPVLRYGTWVLLGEDGSVEPI